MKRHKKHSGYIVDKMNGDTTIVGIIENYGYLIYSIKSKELQVIPTEIIMDIFDRFKFTNAVVENNTIACTTCDIDNLPKYTIKNDRHTVTDLIPKSPNSYYILARIMLDKENYAYRVVTGDCHVLDFRDTDIIRYIEQGGNIVNASLINGELKVINN